MKSLTPAFITMIMLLIVGGLIAAYVVRTLFARETPVAQIQTRLVPMALADLEPGTEIRAEHLGRGPVTDEKLERDVVLSNDALLGRVVREKITSAQPIRTAQLFPFGQRPPLEVAEGYHAMTLGVADATSLVDGLIAPGEFVDVHFTPAGNPDPASGGGFTMTLFKGVKLLAVNGNPQLADLSRGGNTVTVELSEAQTNAMILARDRGDITLSLNTAGRGNGGIALNNSERVTLNEILGIVPEEKPEPEAPEQIEIYRGASRGLISFNSGGSNYGNDDDDGFVDGMYLNDTNRRAYDPALVGPGSRSRDNAGPNGRSSGTPRTTSPELAPARGRGL